MPTCEFFDIQDGATVKVTPVTFAKAMVELLDLRTFKRLSPAIMCDTDDEIAAAVASLRGNR
jgi:hypothetical protein